MLSLAAADCWAAAGGGIESVVGGSDDSDDSNYSATDRQTKCSVSRRQPSIPVVLTSKRMDLRSSLFDQCPPPPVIICSSISSTKTTQCDDVESFQESTGEDQKASGTSEQDKELFFMDANRFVFNIANYLGFHNARKDSSGTWQLSQWRLVPVVVQLAISVAGFLFVIYQEFFCDLQYYQGIMLLPIAFSMSFCIDVYLSTFPISKPYLKYLSTIEAHDVKMKPFKKMPIVATAGLVTSIIYTVCSLLVTSLSQNNIFVLMFPVFTSTYLPTFLDMHMFSFNLMLKQQVSKLRYRIRRVNQWTTAEVSGVARQWLLLCRLFRLHNTVRLPLFLSRQHCQHRYR